MTDVLSAQVTVTSAGAKLVARTPASSTLVTCRNRDSANSVFIGPPGVTTTTGTEVKAGESMAGSPTELPPETELWAVTTSALTARVDTLLIEGD